MAASLSQKLQLKPGQAFTLLNAPENYANQLAAGGLPLAEAVPAAALMLFVRSMDELLRLTPGAIAALQDGALFWIAYPKGSSKAGYDVNRDTLAQAVEAMGWRPVRQIALDEVWSALRFRPAGQAGR
ncbi:MAG TPA: hypothetical protein GYA06_09495 [Chloroflexi bacterium]|nr:hypothetical protein [Chloroflexota bacterium]